MKIQLSDHFTYRKLLRFTFPSIVTTICASIYSIIDGLFVSNLVGDLELSAINIVMPVIMIIEAFGFMLGVGGSAVTAKSMGESKQKQANRYFSMFVWVIAILGIVLSVIGIICMEPLARLAGASDLLIRDSVLYGRILLTGAAVFMLQLTFQSFLIVAEKPHMALWLSLAAGVTNMVMDYVFIKIFWMGIAGAGFATIIGYSVGGIIPLVYFLHKKSGSLQLMKTKFYGKPLLNACANGSSEMMNNIAASLVGIIYNIQLIWMLGEAGVAAYSIIMYVDFIFLGTFFGFSFGGAPVISYQYGAENHGELQNLFRKSLMITGMFSIIMVVVSEMSSYSLSRIFINYNRDLLEITVHGFRLFALNYIICGLNVFSSSFFTALCNGKVSALLSFMRALVLRGGITFLLPVFWGVDGIWLAVMVAEILASVFSIVFFITKRKRYGYA
ncbi:MAG: polysaccharide biosynthesis C-terminal domain-containing protein [Lachnospiraceae bacterium]|nr:polysaccharide biosynthesis C-terminal domain-containing protein [Lachnospiraceae bacterium]